MDADYRSSLVRRLRAVHSLYDEACATMTLDQVNAVTSSNDTADCLFPGAPGSHRRWKLGLSWRTGSPFDDGWASRIGLGVKDHGKARSVAEMMHQRIGDYGAFREFQQSVFDASETYVASIEPDSFMDVIAPAPYGETLAHTFSALVGGDAGITRSDALECWVYQHALRHMGEIEHARSLVGLSGMTS